MSRISKGRQRYLLRGRLCSPAAGEWLKRAESASIISLHRASANLVDDNLGVLSLNLPEAGPNPFALVVHPDLAGFWRAGGFASALEPDDHVWVDGSTLIAGRLSVDLSKLSRWEPRPSWESVRREQLHQRVGELSSLLRQHGPAGSLAPLLRSPRTEDASGADDFIATAIQAARAPAESLLAAVAARDAPQLADAAGRLAGLGVGVTPAGDDYLMGAMHALWVLLGPGEATRLSQVLAESARPRTNQISGAWLMAAARGEAAESWHTLLAALSDGAEGTLTVPGLALIRVGHTSGADALTGFLGMLQVLGNQKLRWDSAQPGDADGTV